MGPHNRCCIRNKNVTVDSDSSVAFPIRVTKRDRRDLERVPITRPTRRNRRIQPTNTKIWVRRLFAVSLIASLSKTDDVFAPVCDAFVAPTSKSKVSLRSEQWRITKTENRKNENVMTPMSRRLDRNTGGTTTSSLSNSPTSPNGMNGGANGNNNNNKSSKNKDMEIAGLVLAVAIILSLAGMAPGPSGGVGNSEEAATASVAVMTKVVENTVPTTSTEVVAVTLGESIGGVIGAIFSVGINFLIKGGKSDEDSSTDSEDSEDSNGNSNSNNSNGKKSSDMSSVVSQGLSDGDYFIANSASNALLESVGVPESVAKYSSILIAAIPSQLVKIGSRISEQKRAKEEELLASLVRDEEQRKAKKNSNAISSLWKKNNKKTKKLVPVAVAAATVGGVVSSSTSETAAVAATAIDFVEIFADVTRWLEYDVLKTEYGETALSQLWRVESNLAAINPLQSALTFALLGALAAVSSRWYADALYGRFGYGPIEKQREVRTRDSKEWFSMYSSTAASAAVLFGCYEFFQLPVGRYIVGTLSGGIEGCVGSSNFDACMQTYIDTNSPGPTAQAQLRALVTNLYAVYIRLQDIAADTTTDDMSALVRAWSVSIASYIANMQ